MSFRLIIARQVCPLLFTARKCSTRSRFEELAPPNNEMKWKALISNINAHNAHHGGQIVLLRKLQGSWESGKGVS